MSDVVVDTNIIVHAHMKGQSRQADAIAFFQEVLRSDVYWCFDDGMRLEEADNRSPIFSEYRQHASPPMLGMQVLAALARNNRVRLVARAEKAPRRVIRELVWDSTDRVFVDVAHGTESRLLVSHDVTGFPDKVCAAIQKRLNVSVVDAREAVERIA